MRSKLRATFLIAIAVIACHGLAAAAAPVVLERADVPYAADVPDGKHRLDVFAPSGARNAPVLIFIHGGDWHVHDRKDYSFLGRSLAAEGFVVVVPSYRLWPSANGLEMADDVARATAWTLHHARDYGGNPNSVILSGHSSGAHLAALIALDPQYLARYGIPTSAIHGVISISGIEDLRQLNGAVVFGAFGRTPDQRWSFSPLKYVHRGAPPFALVCAQGDPRLLCVQGLYFLVRMRMAGGVADYFMAPGNHGSEILAAASPANSLHQRIVQFVRTHQ
jgi:acetyl esterase/lipase